MCFSNRVLKDLLQSFVFDSKKKNNFLIKRRLGQNVQLFPSFIFKALQTQHNVLASVLYFYFGICLAPKEPL